MRVGRVASFLRLSIVSGNTALADAKALADAPSKVLADAGSKDLADAPSEATDAPSEAAEAMPSNLYCKNISSYNIEFRK